LGGSVAAVGAAGRASGCGHQLGLGPGAPQELKDQVRRLGLDLLGLMHLVFLDLSIGMPVFSIVVIAITRLRRQGVTRFRLTARARLFTAILMIPAPIAAYATFVEPYRLAVERVRIDVGDTDGPARKLRIAVVADLQFQTVSDYERQAARKTMALQPDLVLIPGDVIQAVDQVARQQLPDVRRLLASLAAPGGTFIVQGDMDRPSYLSKVTEGTGVRWLHNEIANVNVQGVDVAIGGVELDYQSAAASAMIGGFSRRERDADVRILLVHRPDVVMHLPSDSGIDIVIAGHTHGGQVRLPLIGPPITASRLPRAVAAGGLHTYRNHRLYISRGVGLERGQAPRLRFLCPPEITCMTLTVPGGQQEVSGSDGSD